MSFWFLSVTFRPIQGNELCSGMDEGNEIEEEEINPSEGTISILSLWSVVEFNHDDNIGTELGFLEPFDDKVWNICDNGKVGGRALYLNPRDLFDSSLITCLNCSQTMVFLCQVYAPIDSMEDRA